MSRSVSSVWSDESRPRIAIPEHGELRVRLPYSPNNFDWLRIGQRRPRWDKSNKFWSIPRSHLNRIARQALDAFGQCWIIQTVGSLEICAPACWSASGLDCECACLGENHGSQNDDGWFVVGESFACRSGGKDYSIRLIGQRVRRPTDSEFRSGGAKWKTYVIRHAGDAQHVKIGRTTNLRQRLKALQTASPRRVEIVAIIDGDHEAWMHMECAESRVRLEWFKWGAQVASAIEKAKGVRS